MLRILLILALSLSLQAKVKLVTSTTDLADIARQVGGEHVTTISISKGPQDPHYVEVLPSHMMRVKQADVYLKVGMGLDRWADQIIDGSRNARLAIIDCSRNIRALEVPTGKVDASMGDIHPHGNPHYWLDPENGKIIARTIAEALIRVDPGHAEAYEANLTTFIRSLETLQASWGMRYADLKGKRLIYYHNTWPYFNRAFGLIASGFIEPKPGISASPAHLEQLIQMIGDSEIKVLAVEPYFSSKAPEFIHKKTSISIVELAQSVGARNGVASYQDLFAYNLNLLAQGFEK